MNDYKIDVYSVTLGERTGDYNFEASADVEVTIDDIDGEEETISLGVVFGHYGLVEGCWSFEAHSDLEEKLVDEIMELVDEIMEQLDGQTDLGDIEIDLSSIQRDITEKIADEIHDSKGLSFIGSDIRYSVDILKKLVRCVDDEIEPDQMESYLELAKKGIFLDGEVTGGGVVILAVETDSALTQWPFNYEYYTEDKVANLTDLKVLLENFVGLEDLEEEDVNNIINISHDVVAVAVKEYDNKMENELDGEMSL